MSRKRGTDSAAVGDRSSITARLKGPLCYNNHQTTTRAPQCTESRCCVPEPRFPKVPLPPGLLSNSLEKQAQQVQKKAAAEPIISYEITEITKLPRPTVSTPVPHQLHLPSPGSSSALFPEPDTVVSNHNLTSSFPAPQPDMYGFRSLTTSSCGFCWIAAVVQ